MHSSGLIATAAATGRLLTVAPIENICIPELLVKNAFYAFASGRTKSSRTSLSAGALKLVRQPNCQREFHTGRSLRTSQKSKTVEASEQRSGGLFSWSVDLKNSLGFNYSPPSSKGGSIGSLETLGSTTPDEDESGSPWLLSKGAEVSLKHLHAAKTGSLIGLPPQVPYSTAKSPLGPWLSAPRDRLNELIQNDKLPPAGSLRPSTRRSAIVDQQVQDILHDLLNPSSRSEVESRSIHLDRTPETITEQVHVSKDGLQLIPYVQQSFALVVSQAVPILHSAEAISGKDECLRAEGAGLSAAFVDPIPSPIESIQPTGVELLAATQRIPVTAANIAEVENVEQSHNISISKQILHPGINHSAAADTSFDFIKEIYWEGVNLPLQPPKILLSKEARVDMSSLPTMAEIQSKLLKLAGDPLVPLETRVLTYSQLDMIYGLENLPDPLALLNAFLQNLDNVGWMDINPQELSGWFSTHRSIPRLKNKGLLSDTFVDEAVKAITAGRPSCQSKIYVIRNRDIDNALENPDTPMYTAWAVVKGLLKKSGRFSKPKVPRLPLSVAKIFLERIIKLLHSGTWNGAKAGAVRICLEIFQNFFEFKGSRPALLFSELARFFIAWKRHWSTPEFLNHTAQASEISPNANNLLEPEVTKHSPLPNIPELDKFFGILPGEYVDRLVCTLSLHAAVHSSKPLSEARYLKRVMLFARRRSATDLTKRLHRDRNYLPFLRDPGLYEKRVALEGHRAVAKYVQGFKDIEIISFYLRTWPAYHGVRYIDDRKLLGRVQHALEDVIDRIRIRLLSFEIDARPRAPGLPFAQAILSLFYLNLPTEGIIVGIFLALSHSKKIQELKSCLNILSHFEGKYNGQVKFKIPKQGTSIALNCFRENHLPWALELLIQYHNRHQKTYAKVILAAADKYPSQSYIVFQQFLKPLCVTSIWNPQISFWKPAGWPSKSFLRDLAISYALSNYHSPNSATRKIMKIRKLYATYGYGVSMRITRALVATSMIRTATHRLWTGPELTAADDLFKHGRLKFAIVAFMQDADKSRTYLVGLTKDEAMAKKKEFIERCIREVWAEIYKRKKYQFALATEKRNLTQGII